MVADAEAASIAGPLNGVRVVELASIGPGPHCAMLLSDLGAEVLRIDRPGGTGWANPIADRGRHSLTVDIRTPEGRELCAAMADKADVLIEGLRPGTVERLGLGPQVLCSRNPRLIFARLTGWGQTGPRADTAGHDINYIALSGALAAMGRPGEPASLPLNLVGDFGAGSLFGALGIIAALYERHRSGLGQVIDIAIVDGVASLMSMFAGLLSRNAISLHRDRNMLAGAAPFYRCYLCADGKEVAVGALEPKFYRQLIDRLAAPAAFRESQYDAGKWPERAVVLAKLFAQKTRAEWAERFADLDACVAPVLTLQESYEDPHLRARSTYVKFDELLQAAPAPRFSRTPGQVQSSGPGAALVKRWGIAIADDLEG
jgi:alpha-methylacyl-CoA racemase